MSRATAMSMLAAVRETATCTGGWGLCSGRGAIVIPST